MKWRVPAGFLLAPILPCAILEITASAFINQQPSIRFGTIALILVSEALSLLVGVPLYFLLRRYRSISLVDCVLSGVAIAVLVNATVLVFPSSPGYSAGDHGGATVVNGHLTTHGFISALVATAAQSLLGAAIGLCFWVIAIRPLRRHDGDE
jgi:hypothetical protein